MHSELASGGNFPNSGILVVVVEGSGCEHFHFLLSPLGFLSPETSVAEVRDSTCGDTVGTGSYRFGGFRGESTLGDSGGSERSSGVSS